MTHIRPDSNILNISNRAIPALTPPAAAPPAEQSRLRLSYLDGLRGIAALYVVLFHGWTEMAWGAEGGRLPLLHSAFLKWLTYGHHSVVVFIVLSGYCLMIPVARAPQGKSPGGALGYLKRRARRILPPYYAALALSIPLMLASAALGRRGSSSWSAALSSIWPGPLVSHLLLIHNLRPDWVYAINNPLWSVATEWQIYFLFPMLLLPMWRRFGNAGVIFAGLVAGLGLYLAFPGSLAGACPWYVALFAMGMAGAAANFRPQGTGHLPNSALPMPARAGISLAAGAAIMAVYALAPRLLGPAVSTPSFLILMDLSVGAFVTCVLVASTQALLDPVRRLPVALRLLQSRPVTALGAFSYSLYLIHWPILHLLHQGLQAAAAPPLSSFLALLCLGAPLSVAAAYLFHVVFEKPFLPGEGRSRLRFSNGRSRG